MLRFVHEELLDGKEVLLRAMAEGGTLVKGHASGAPIDAGASESPGFGSRSSNQQVADHDQVAHAFFIPVGTE